MRVKDVRLEELRRLYLVNGNILHPEVVVDAARSPDSVLHDCFEWDDSVAASEYRVWQARKLITCYVEVVKRSVPEHQVFVSLSSDRVAGGGYRTLVSVMTDDLLRYRLLEDALAELRVFQRKYSSLVELVDVFREVAKVELLVDDRLSEEKT